MNNDLQLHCSYFNINKNYLLKWLSLYYLESLDLIQHIVMLFKWLHSCLTFAGKFSCKSFTQKLCKSRTCQSCLCLRFTPQRILSIKGYYSLQQCSPADLKGLTDEREGKRKPGGGGGVETESVLRQPPCQVWHAGTSFHSHKSRKLVLLGPFYR